MNIEFMMGLLIGIPIGAFVALSYSGIVFVLLARIVIKALAYRFDFQDWRTGPPPEKPKPDLEDTK